MGTIIHDECGHGSYTRKRQITDQNEIEFKYFLNLVDENLIELMHDIFHEGNISTPFTLATFITRSFKFIIFNEKINENSGSFFKDIFFNMLLEKRFISESLYQQIMIDIDHFYTMDITYKTTYKTRFEHYLTEILQNIPIIINLFKASL